MDEIIYCPNCHQPIRSTDYFCPNCGKKIHSPPPSTSLLGQIILYLKALILPPLGFFWGYQYLQQSDTKSKLIGLFVIIITFIEIIWLTQTTVNMVDFANQQINQQMNLYGF
jgi:hypothetical protein